MAIHAAANIAMAVDNFKNRGYAQLGGIILNRRDVPREEEKVAELADDFHTKVIGTLSHSEQVALAEEQGDDIDGMLSRKCYGRGISYDCQKDVHLMWWRITGGNLDVAASR